MCYVYKHVICIYKYIYMYSPQNLACRSGDACLEILAIAVAHSTVLLTPHKVSDQSFYAPTQSFHGLIQSFYALNQSFYTLDQSLYALDQSFYAQTPSSHLPRNPENCCLALSRSPHPARDLLFFSLARSLSIFQLGGFQRWAFQLEREQLTLFLKDVDLKAKTRI